MAFMAGLGASIASALGMAGPVTAGTATALGTGALAAGAAATYGATQAIGAGIKSMTKVPEVSGSSVESASDSLTNAQQSATAVKQDKLKRASRSRSIFSSPLGIGGEATTVKKSLLGQ